MKTDALNETTAFTDVMKIKMGRAKRPVQELRLMASLLSSRQFELLATAGFDLVEINNPLN